MQYYSENETKDLRLALENEVLHWGRVSFKKMFGCPCYKVNEKLFVFLVTKGIVFTSLNEADRTELAMHYQITVFNTGNKSIKNWIQIALDSLKELESLMPYVRNSYQEARGKTD